MSRIPLENHILAWWMLSIVQVEDKGYLLSNKTNLFGLHQVECQLH